MPPTPKLRRLFQALSVLSVAACVLLLVLLARSYSRYDMFAFRYEPVGTFSLLSSDGHLRCHWGSAYLFSREDKPAINMEEWPLVFASDPIHHARRSILWWFQDKSTQTERMILVPFWFPVLIASSLAVAPWVRPRYSVRTMLIAISLVAILLGMVAWATT